MDGDLVAADPYDFNGTLVNILPQCLDIDECEEDSTSCDTDTGICTNTRGSFQCSCQAGYSLGEDGRNCTDIDECTENLDNCDPDAMCINQPGSFQCTCNDGFSGDGQDCIEIIFFAFGPDAGDDDIVADVPIDPSMEAYQSYTYHTVDIDTGFPIGNGGLYPHITFTSSGVIEFWDSAPSNLLRYVNPSLYTWYEQLNDDPAVTVFGAAVDLSLGEPHIYYKVYDGRVAPTSDFFAIRTELQQQIRDAVSLEFSEFSSSTFLNGIEYILEITWENVEPPGSAADTGGNETNTYQSILFTDGTHSGILMIFQEQSMLWNPASKSVAAQRGYNIKSSRFNKYENNFGVQLLESYRPDQIVGNTGLLGRDMYRLDDNPTSYVNPRQYCLDWYNSDTVSIFSAASIQPCPCSLDQGLRDARFTFCNTPTTINFILPDSDVLPRYYCCSQSGSAEFCDLYETRRPPSTCQNYRPPIISWFFGDPHINTLDGRGYTFNGLGEYVMLEYTNGDPFVLQARTGKAFDEDGSEVDTGTVFTGFAGTQGITTIRITLNSDRTEMLIQVNDTDMDINTLQTDGFNSTDDLFSLSFDNNATGDLTASEIRVTASFTDSAGVQTGFRVSFQLGVLDVTVSGPSDYAELGVGRGLLGLWNGDPADDFQFRNGTILTPAPGTNLSDSELFDFGQSWMINSSESLFDYGSGSWSDYNDPDFMPPFLDELTAAADPSTLATAEQACGDNRECLFDYLAVGPSLGLSSMAIADRNEMDQQQLENFPPEIIGIEEVGGTDALMPNNTLHVQVGQTYMLRVTATDPNNDTVTYSLNGTVPQNASINDDGVLTWTPMNTDRISLDIVASDDTAQSVVSLLVKICLCENNGTCDFQTEADGENINNARSSVVVCNCLEGYNGNHCESDENSCAGDPCYLGVICFDDPPPSMEPRCGACPPFLTGDGFSCFDINECAEMTDDCEQDCHNTQGSYTCSCSSGYTLSLDMRSCLDVDECSRNTHDCSEHSECVNTDGYFNCSCNTGFMTVPGDEHVCEDEDECRDPTLHRCDEQATCRNGVGYFSCFCNDGWTGDGLTCSNINECENGTNNCSPFAVCADNPGSYTCECREGFAGTGTSCFDIDECADETLNNCTAGSYCVNTEGSFECPCLDGYNVTSNDLCEDIDECATMNVCEELCNNTIGSFQCGCQDGFALDSDERSCSDINECLDPGSCSANAECNNTHGGFACSCSDGYNGTGYPSDPCTNVNECATQSPCGSNARCIDTDGSYSCTCIDGYAGNGDQCVDIDECFVGMCDVNADCVNSIGSYTCTCRDGYNGTGDTCTDINECDNATLCADAATCTNTNGSYTCYCSEGYRGDPYSMCGDIDECKDDPTICPSEATCSNMIGSYECICNEGYESDGVNCTDTNECQGDFCGFFSTCTNTIGSAFCVCDDGYESSNRKNCTDFDECAFETSSCPAGISVCNNTPGDYECICSTGYQNSGPKTCEDANECIDGSHNCSDDRICINTLGSYRCECPDMSYEATDGACIAANTFPLVARFSVVTGLEVIVYSAILQGPETHETLSNDTLVQLQNSALTRDVLEVSVFNFTLVGNSLMEFTFRVAFPSSSNITAESLENVFYSGVTPVFNRVEPNHIVQVEDVNECELFEDICRNGNCSNTIDGYNCTCNDGYGGNGDICSDINECQTGLNNCSQVCVNNEGSFSCECFGGYARDGEACIDIDECNEDDHGCEHICQNTNGSYVCECNEGFELAADLRSCTAQRSSSTPLTVTITSRQTAVTPTVTPTSTTKATLGSTPSVRISTSSTENPASTSKTSSAATTTAPTTICTEGTVLRGGQCLYAGQTMAVVTILEINGTATSLNEALQNPNSTAFRQLEADFGSAIIANANLTDDVADVTITDITGEPISVTVLIEVFGETQDEVNDRIAAFVDFEDALVRSDASTFLLRDFAVSGTLSTSTSLTATLTPTTGGEGLSSGVIVGIVLGCLSFVLLFFLMAVCCLYVGYARRRHMTKVLMSEGYGTTNPAMSDDDDELSSDLSLYQRREAVRRAINQINRDSGVLGGRGPSSVLWNTGQLEARGIGGLSPDFMTPYVVDGSEASYVTNRTRSMGVRPVPYRDDSPASQVSDQTHVERNPMHDDQLSYYY
ncbi:uncharacterized protein [Diadema setosum]|uniref:uncharacterized protein n=1 Tax=Diadema setosum TaxID=31175 RepID=UPI003B3B5827